MNIQQWAGQAGQSIGDDLLSRVTDEIGLPTLPPLSISPNPPNSNPNNYVQPRNAPVQPPAPEVNSPSSFLKKYGKIVGGAAVVVGVLYLVMRRK